MVTERLSPRTTASTTSWTLKKKFINNHTTITAGDFIQFAGAVGVSNCLGAPRLEFLLGHPKAAAASPPGLVPEPQDTVTCILARFQEVNFSPEEVVALLASHTVVTADHVDPTVAGYLSIHLFFVNSNVLTTYHLIQRPASSIPSTFFIETQLHGIVFPVNGSNVGEAEAPLPRRDATPIRFFDSRTACAWQSMTVGQANLQAKFKAAMSKMATIGTTVIGTLHLPAGKTMNDIEQACASAAFPSLTAEPGPATSVPPV
ncbi:Peroxidase [Mycena venus]|uniref:Peroxidase n=1 Tax=Mycena venus TaxID=2733690 RepID=A0A8H7D656_9AGAR|nr:Peroxidase [Mycena venus]